MWQTAETRAHDAATGQTEGDGRLARRKRLTATKQLTILILWGDEAVGRTSLETLQSRSLSDVPLGPAPFSRGFRGLGIATLAFNNTSGIGQAGRAPSKSTARS